MLVAEYSRIPGRGRSSLVRPIRRDVTAAARHETSLLQQRLGAAVWSYQERRKTKAGEKEQTSREDGPVTLQEEKNHIIYLGLALLGSRSGGSELADHVSIELFRKIDIWRKIVVFQFET